MKKLHLLNILQVQRSSEREVIGLLSKCEIIPGNAERDMYMCANSSIQKLIEISLVR